MMKRYSINKRIVRTVVEIVTGTIVNLILLLVLSYALIFAGQLNTYGTDYHISISDNRTTNSIKNQIEHTVFDYVLFDSETGELVSGKYQKKICNIIRKFLTLEIRSAKVLYCIQNMRIQILLWLLEDQQFLNL